MQEIRVDTQVSFLRPSVRCCGAALDESQQERLQFFLGGMLDKVKNLTFVAILGEISQKSIDSFRFPSLFRLELSHSNIVPLIDRE
jgi:hypothetical protein